MVKLAKKKNNFVTANNLLSFDVFLISSLRSCGASQICSLGSFDSVVISVDILSDLSMRMELLIHKSFFSVTSVLVRIHFAVTLDISKALIDIKIFFTSWMVMLILHEFFNWFSLSYKIAKWMFYWRATIMDLFELILIFLRALRLHLRCT